MNEWDESQRVKPASGLRSPRSLPDQLARRRRIPVLLGPSQIVIPPSPYDPNQQPLLHGVAQILGQPAFCEA